MTVVCLTVKVHQWELQLYQVAATTQNQYFTGLDLSQVLLFSWVSLTEGCAFAGGLLLAYGYFRHQRKVKHPGHWLILLTAIEHLFYLGLGMTQAIYVSHDIATTYYDFLSYTYFVIAIIGIVAWLAVTLIFARRFGKLWFLSFGMLAIFRNGTPSHLFLTLAILNAILVVIAGSVRRDLQQNVRRDWLHWFGVLLISCSLLFNLIFYLTTAF